MKKIVILLLCFISLLNVNASEIRKVGNKVYEKQELAYLCDGNIYKMYTYMDNKIILSDNNDENFYTYNEIDGCKKISVNDKLKLNSRLVGDVEFDEDEEYMLITTYKRFNNLVEGFTLNTDEYNEETIYNTYNEEDESFNEVNHEELNKDNLNEYYVSKYFKGLSSNETSSDNTYYIKDDKGIFVVFKDEITDDNIFDIYELVKEEDKYNSKKTYKLSHENYNKFMEKYSDEDKYDISFEIINTTLYFNVTEYENEEIKSIKYIDIDEKELFPEYDIKEIEYYDGYYVVDLYSENKYKIYDENLNFITDIEFDTSSNLYDVDIDYNNMYFNFIDEEGNPITYYIKTYYEADYSKYIIVLSVFILLLTGTGLFLKFKKK